MARKAVTAPTGAAVDEALRQIIDTRSGQFGIRPSMTDRDLVFMPRGLVDFTARTPEQKAARMVAAVETLAGFVRMFWEVLHGGRPMVWGPHIDVVCYALEELFYGNVEGNELVICIPPRHLKSEIVSVFYPAWRLLRRPYEQILSIANAKDLASRDAMNMRKVVESAPYLALVAVAGQILDDDTLVPWGMSKDQNTKTYFKNDLGGGREAKSVEANITGTGADLLIIDDPIDAKKGFAGSTEMVNERMQRIIEYYDGAWESRLNDPTFSQRVVIMQRLHENDLAGHLLAGGVVGVVLPTEYEPDHPDVCPWDWRTQAGELLFPERLSGDALARKQADLDTYAAQQQQRPTAKAGNTFDRILWKTFPGHPIDLAYEIVRRGGYVLTSWDCANKVGARNAWSVCVVLGVLGDDRYVLHVDRRRVELDGLLDMFDEAVRVWPMATRHFVEDAANGSGLLTLRPLAEEVRVMGGGMGKAERAAFTRSTLAKGNLYIPEDAPWKEVFLREHAVFPHGRFADQVDALAQGIIETHRGPAQGAFAARVGQEFGWLDDYGEGPFGALA